MIIENKNAFDLIEKHIPESETLWYIDPPYVHSTRRKIACKYQHELSDKEHKKLINMLLKISGKVVLSGYDNAIYSKLEKSGWKKVQKDYKKNYIKDKITECLWMNFEAQKDLFSYMKGDCQECQK